MLSSGVRQALAMAGGWLFAAGCVAFGLVYHEHIRAMARVALGTSTPAAQIEQDSRLTRVARQSLTSARTVELKAGQNGHYYARAEVNGRAIDVLVDTGATMVALTWDDANRAGLVIRDSDYTQRIHTANGMGRVAPVTLDRVSIGSITVRDVPAAVSEPGMLTTSLLGMSFLGRLQRVDMRSGVLLLLE
jgi:aspartyl protease family protein